MTRDEGSIALETVLLAPLLLLLLGLVHAYGQVAQLHGALESGVRDAARAASQARTAQDAADAARRAVTSSLGGVTAPCAQTLEVDVSEQLVAGGTVRVAARCTSTLAGLGMPGLPGGVTVASAFSSPVDPLRGVEGP